MKVLLVEDNSRIARPLTDDLRRQHHAVDVTEDGIKGWEYAESTAYDLILLLRCKRINKFDEFYKSWRIF